MSMSHEGADGNTIGTAIREAIYAGLISFGLFFLLIGLETTQNISNELILVQRWGLLATVVAVVMVVRFLFVAFVLPPRRGARLRKLREIVEAEPGFVRRNFSVLAIVFLLLFPIIVVATSGLQGSLKWIDNFGIQILIYVMLAWGLNIVVGLAGLLDLGYVAFYAVGAYAYALLGTEFGWSFWILLPCAGIMAAFWGIILGFPVLRLRGDYLAIVTLAFGEIIRLVLINWREVTNGAAGISGVPKVSFFGIFTFNVSDPNYISKVLTFLPTSGVYYKIFLILLLCWSPPM
jgi:branched-chain amino acid transport system permease protein